MLVHLLILLHFLSTFSFSPPPGLPHRLHLRLHPEAGVQVRVRREGGHEGLRHVHSLKVTSTELDRKGTGNRFVFLDLLQRKWMFATQFPAVQSNFKSKQTKTQPSENLWSFKSRPKTSMTLLTKLLFQTFKSFIESMTRFKENVSTRKWHK